MIFTQTNVVPTTDRKPATLVSTSGQPCALKETRVVASVAGFVAEVRVEHVFENPHDEVLNALYTFPLPHDAAVTAFAFTVAGKLVKGEVREREAARAEFVRAASAGKHAGLVEEKRPNVFELELANIPARGEVRSELTYFEALPYANGEFEFRFPTVVAPRYSPKGSPEPGTRPGGGELPLRANPGHTVALSLAIDAGMPIESFRCDTHALTASRDSANAVSVRLADAAALPDRDVIVRYKVGGAGIRLGVIAHRPDPAQDGTFYMFAVPPAEVATADVRGKEVVFVVDRSGSMEGEKMEKAREAVKACLRGLNPADRFAIVLFDDQLVALDDGRPAPVTDAEIARAEKWIDNHGANGGTDVLPAIEKVLAPAADPTRQRIVVLITDGQVNNEAQVLAYVRAHLGSARLFTVGIDTAVNTYLLSKLARFGRGAAEFVLPTGDIEGVIARLANRIGSPLLTDPVADFGTVRVSDLTPHPLPDVMAGQVVVVAGRYRGQGTTEVVFSGQGPGRLLEHRVEVTFPRDATATPACEKIWARLMIDRLEEDLLDDPASPTLKQKIAALAIQHGMMSSQTSFLAIDEREGDPEKAKRAIRQHVPVALPAGWDQQQWLGGGGGMGQLAMCAGLDGLADVDMDLGGLGSVDRLSACGSSPAPRAAAPAARSVSYSEAPKRPSARPRARQLDPGLRQLAKRQSVNGSWNGSVVATALAIAAFASHGHTDRDGDFTAQVRRAVEYLEASLESGWTATPGSLDALSVAFGLAWLARQTHSGAHAELADRFAQVGAAAVSNLGAALAEVRAEALKAGLGDEVLDLLD